MRNYYGGEQERKPVDESPQDGWRGGVMRERSRLREKRNQDKNQKKTHNRENPKEMLESNSTDPEPIFPKKKQSLFTLPLTRKRKARKVSKNEPQLSPKQASKQAKVPFLKKKRLWDKTGSRGEEERNGC